MEMVVENRIVQDINGHGTGQLFQPVTDPIFSVAVVVVRKRIEPEKTPSSDQPIPAVIDADFVDV